jgi:carboxyl-terminal processing protease
MTRHAPRKSMRLFLGVLLFVTLPLYSCASKTSARIARSGEPPIPATVEAPCTEEVLTGNELEVVNRFVRPRGIDASHQFTNVLDQAMWILLAMAYPEQERASLIGRTIGGICLETRRLSREQVPEQTRAGWVRQVLAEGSFEPTLRQAEGLVPAGAGRRELIDAGLRGMLDSVGWLLDDVQAGELTNIAADREAGTEPGLLGIDVGRWPIISPVPGGPAEQAGLKDGDAVLRLGDTPVEKVPSGGEAISLLAGPSGQAVLLTVQRNGETLSFRIRRVAAATWLIRDKVVAPGVLYIKIPTFEGTGIAKKVERILGAHAATCLHAVILDLRDNRGGRPEQANAIADQFLDNVVLEVFEFRSGRRVAFKSSPGALDAAVVVLANRNTGSAAEMLAMALRDNRRATIVGEPTVGVLFGKEGQKLDDGRMVVFRCEPRILSPVGKDYSAGGIPPDVTVAPGEGTGEDPALRRAIEVALGSAAGSRPARRTGE